MPSLSRELRGLLQRTIAGKDGARQIAEAGAEQALQRLAVDRHEPHSSLTPEDRALRNQLRAHGRQLGDKRDLQRGTQTIDHLTQAVAYEHWHRLLFARFLAENDLLIHPEHGVALTLDEVKELALGKGWDWIELAADYAQRMLLREVFRSDDPALRVPLPPEKRLELEQKLNALPREIFLADDSLGWVYQFWQEDAKEEVNSLELKIGPDELSPVTQLFTEDYMVLFLLENTLGAWWTSNRGRSNLAGYTWTYLRLNGDGTPTSGTFKNWPKTAKELKVLDPSMGSGHFLTFALPILARMRAEEEELPLADAISSVLHDNLFGLELDPRCSQIAAFNLALTAWKLAGRHFKLPRLHLACSGLGINTTVESWVKLAGEDQRAVEAMRRLFDLFRDAPTLGSLIDPSRLRSNLFTAEFAEVRRLLFEALSAQQGTEDASELAIAAEGLLAAAEILGDKFTLVATNVPYLARNKQCNRLKEYCEEFHGDAKADLATCFVDRNLRWCAPGGSTALVTPQNWLFLTNYRRLRSQLLQSYQWDAVVRLGFNAFQIMNWWATSTSLLVVSRQDASDDHKFAGFDVASARTPAEKAELLKSVAVQGATQSVVAQKKESVINFSAQHNLKSLSDFVTLAKGICTGDRDRFVACFWELPKQTPGWTWFKSSVNVTVPIGGCEYILYWEDGRGEFINFVRERLGGNEGAWVRGESVWRKLGVSVSRMGHLPCSLYHGELFDDNSVVLVPNKEEDLPWLWDYASSGQLAVELRKINQKLSVDNTYFGLIPIESTESNTQLPSTTSTNPTQWLFSGHPKGSNHPLQVAVARLLGYRWPRQTGSNFTECPAPVPDDLAGYSAADGILCLSSVAGEESAGTRLRSLLQSALGVEYNLPQLLLGKKSGTLETWLRDEFFEEHCQIFLQRPFVWHVWDGLKDGFHALVNYHNLDRRNLEKLIFSYLGDWLSRQRQDVQNGVEGADTRLAAAEHLQGELKRILEGEGPYDIFVRWKPIKRQPIGWEPDLNDGVRVNIRPWVTEAKLYKATKPGILRITPSIKYTKDRGKEPSRDAREFPWYAGSTDRINDHHVSLDVKRRARGLS